MLISPQDRFFITDGVHRSLAMRMLGFRSIPAQLMEDGVKLGDISVHPDQLSSSKTEIRRWEKGRDFFDLLDLMRTPVVRQNCGTINVETLGSPGQGPSVPLSQVAFVK